MTGVARRFTATGGVIAYLKGYGAEEYHGTFAKRLGIALRHFVSREAGKSAQRDVAVETTTDLAQTADYRSWRGCVQA